MKKVLTLFLALMMVVGCMTILPIGAADTDVKAWNGSESTAPEGTGTADDPYIIDSAADLKWLSGKPNSGNQKFASLGYNHEVWYADYVKYDNADDTTKKVRWQSFLDAPYIYVKQVCDIDLGGNTLTSIASYWSCHGDGYKDVKGQFFHGEYDGQGYTIRNGSFKPQSDNFRWAGGLFGYIWGATVKNITFDNIDLVSNGNSGAQGFAAGAAIGPYHLVKNSATFDAANAAGRVKTVTDTMFSICEQMGKSTIDNIVVTGTCTITETGTLETAVGSILGEANYADISNCASAAQFSIGNSGIAVGGIVGLMMFNTTVDHCSFAGDIVLKSDAVMYYESHLGGIVGSWRSIYNKDNVLGGFARSYGHGAVTNCVNLGRIDVPSTVKTRKNWMVICLGGIIGTTSSLFYAGTGSTYTIENNVNISNEMTSSRGVLARCAPIIGCAYSNGTNKTVFPTDDRNSKNQVFAIIDIVNCRSGVYGHSGAYIKSATGMAGSRGWQNADGTVIQEAREVGCWAYGANYVFGDPFAEEMIDWTARMLMDGKGSESDPFKVNDAQDLVFMRRASTIYNSNAVGEVFFHVAFDDKYFAQTADIDLNGMTLWPMSFYYAEATGDVSVSGAHIHPITGEVVKTGATYPALARRKGSAFGGHYDGQGYAIKNGVLGGSSLSGNTNWGSGIFGNIYGATLENVVLDNITATHNWGTGLLVGKAECDRNRITYDYNEADGTYTCTVTPALVYEGFNRIENCTIINSSLKHDGAGADGVYIAPFASVAFGTTIKNCYTDTPVTVTNGSAHVGGIAGLVGFGSKIVNCINAGSITYYEPTGSTQQITLGGIVSNIVPPVTTDARVHIEITDCVNLADIEFVGATHNNVRKAGGIFGQSMLNAMATKGAKLTNCYNLGDIKVADGYSGSGRCDFGTLAGTAYINVSSDKIDAIEFVNCAGIEISAIGSGNYEMVGTDANGDNNALLRAGNTVGTVSGAFSRKVGQTAMVNGVAVKGAWINNDEELKAVARTEEEVAELTERANAVLSGFKDTKGIKNYGVQSKVEEGKLSLRFINMLAYDLPVESISSISYSYIIAGDKDYESRTFSVTKVYEAVGSADGAKIVAPEGYYYMFAAEVGNGMTTEGSYTVTLNLSYELADGGKVTQLPVTLTVVEGVVSYN